MLEDQFFLRAVLTILFAYILNLMNLLDNLTWKGLFLTAQETLFTVQLKTMQEPLGQQGPCYLQLKIQ